MYIGSKFARHAKFVATKKVNLRSAKFSAVMMAVLEQLLLSTNLHEFSVVNKASVKLILSLNFLRSFTNKQSIKVKSCVFISYLILKQKKKLIWSWHYNIYLFTKFTIHLFTIFTTLQYLFKAQKVSQH